MAFGSGDRAFVLASLMLAACGAKGDAEAEDPGGEAGGLDSSSSGPASGAEADGGAAEEGAAPSDGSSSSGEPPVPPVKYDFGHFPDLADGVHCGAPPPHECDHMDDDPWHAIGLNCPGGPDVDGTVSGDPQAFHVHEGNVGTYDPPPYPPREGDKILIMSSGVAANLLVGGLFASSDIAGFIDNGADPPMPIKTGKVSADIDCAEDPGLVGSGDCSNTIQGQWDQGSGAFDYVEMRFTAEVPAETFAFSYDFAMFSTEYPQYYQSGFNDMYIAWLESESWTGNVSFDEMGQPISLNAGFLDYKDAPNPVDCPAPCVAPQLQGTAMQGHAGTKWLTSTAGVNPGDEITVVFAVFDLSDPILDTVVLLDNFQWGCEGGAPVTIPG